MSGKTIVVLHSGGLDSTVCLYDAFSRGYETISLGIDYDQRHSVEMLFAKRQCEAKGIRREIVRVSWSKPVRETPLGRQIAEIRSEPSPAFLPGRNLVFLALGSAHAAGIGADEIWTGINSIDFSGYPDCTPQFFEAFTAVHKLGGGLTVFCAPLLTKTKPEIAERAKQLGLTRLDTWSCYRPQTASGAITPCGECDACKLHNYSWDQIE